MTTPEGKMKRRVSALLKTYAPELWYTMPVPSGYGESTLDYLGCYNQWFFAIETKGPKNKPTARQELTINMIRNAGGVVFVIIDDDDFNVLFKWLERHASDLSET